MDNNQFDDDILTNLVEDIDSALEKCMLNYDMHPLNITAVVLARLTHLAKIGKYESDFISLLDTPKQILQIDMDTKSVH